MKLANKICAGLIKVRSAINGEIQDFFFGKEEQTLLGDRRAEAYIGEAIKILIAVVIGALLLTLTYTLLSKTVFPTVTKKIKALFGYSG